MEYVENMFHTFLLLFLPSLFPAFLLIVGYGNCEKRNWRKREPHRESEICTDIKSAKQYCPKRWAAVQKWMAESRKVGF